MAGQRLMCAKAVGGHDRQQKKKGRSGAGSADGKAELQEGSMVGGEEDPSSPKRRGLALASMGLPHHWGVLPSPPQRSLASSLHHSRLDKGVSEMLHDATGCGHVRTVVSQETRSCPLASGRGRAATLMESLVPGCVLRSRA